MDGGDDDSGQFMLFSSKTHVEKPTIAQENEKNEEEKWQRRERFETARWRLLPKRSRPLVYDHKHDGVDAGVFGYESWIQNPLLARLPCHSKIHNAGIETVYQTNVEEVLDPEALKKMKARAKNQRRRHAKQAAKKAAAAAAAASASSATTESTDSQKNGTNTDDLKQ